MVSKGIEELHEGPEKEWQVEVVEPTMNTVSSSFDDVPVGP